MPLTPLLPLPQMDSCLTWPLWGRRCTYLRLCTSTTPPTMDTPHTPLAGERSGPRRTWSLGWESGWSGWGRGLSGQREGRTAESDGLGGAQGTGPGLRDSTVTTS